MGLKNYLAGALVAFSMFLPNEIGAQKYTLSDSTRQRLENVVAKLSSEERILTEADYLEDFSGNCGRYKEFNFSNGKKIFCLTMNLLGPEKVSYEIRDKNGKLVYKLPNISRYPPIALDFRKVNSDEEIDLVLAYKKYKKIDKKSNKTGDNVNRYDLFVCYGQKGKFTSPKTLPYEGNRVIYDDFFKLIGEKERSLKEALAGENPVNTEDINSYK